MDDGAFSRLPKSVVATVLLALGGCGSAVPAPVGDATTGGGPATASVTGQSPRPQAPTPGGTPPAAAPTRPGTPVPALRTPAVGDVDGDGRSDHLTLPSPGLVRVGYAGGRSDTVRFEAASEPGARLLGTQDADGDGRAEVFVRSTTGAATQFATVFRYVGGHLRVVTLDGAQTRLAYGGSVTHQDSWAAATLGAPIVTWSGTSIDGRNYSGTLRRYTFSGTRLLLRDSRPYTVTPERLPPRDALISSG